MKITDPSLPYQLCEYLSDLWYSFEWIQSSSAIFNQPEVPVVTNFHESYGTFIVSLYIFYAYNLAEKYILFVL